MKTSLMRQVMFRCTPDEFEKLKIAAGADDISISEFIRLCVNRELAMRGDVDAIDRIMATFQEGIDEYLNARVRKIMEALKVKAG